MGNKKNKDNLEKIIERYVDIIANDKIKKNYVNIHKCLNQNLLIGTSAYIRKTLEELFVYEGIDIKGKKIEALINKLKYPSINSEI
jgi:hypothetical protein